jgi:hypothetical protein
MPRVPGAEPTTRRHVIIYQSDYEEIMALWGEHPGFSFAVRNIIHKYLTQLREKALQGGAAQPIKDHDIEEI